MEPFDKARFGAMRSNAGNGSLYYPLLDDIRLQRFIRPQDEVAVYSAGDISNSIYPQPKVTEVGKRVWRCGGQCFGGVHYDKCEPGDIMFYRLPIDHPIEFYYEWKNATMGYDKEELDKRFGPVIENFNNPFEDMPSVTEEDEKHFTPDDVVLIYSRNKTPAIHMFRHVFWNTSDKDAFVSSGRSAPATTYRLLKDHPYYAVMAEHKSNLDTGQAESMALAVGSDLYASF